LVFESKDKEGVKGRTRGREAEEWLTMRLRNKGTGKKTGRKKGMKSTEREKGGGEVYDRDRIIKRETAGEKEKRRE
jgi:hypothetical protein